MCGCSPSKTPIGSNPSSLMSSSGNFSNASLARVIESGDKQAMVMVEYTGPIKEPFTISSKMSRDVRYRFANNEQHHIKAVLLGDAEYLISMNDKDGNPIYRIISSMGVENANDPAVFLGAPIVA